MDKDMRDAPERLQIAPRAPQAPAAPEPKGCDGCVAREAEIGFLRTQVDKLQDRVFELVSPSAKSVAAPVPMAVDTVETEHLETGQDGQVYIKVGGRLVLLSTYLLAKREGGGIDERGDYVSPKEWQRGMNKLQEMLGGG